MDTSKRVKSGIQGMALGRSDVFNIDPREIKTKEGWNSREAADPANVAHIEQLAASIAEIGVKAPLTVYWEDGAPYVSDGHCRLAATMMAIERGAEIKSVPVITEGRYSSDADRILSQIVRNSGKPLAPIEQARVYKRLIDLGWNEADIATKVGVSRQRIVDLLNLHAAPVEITDMVKEGAISATLAISTMRENREEPAKAAEKLQEAVVKAKAAGKERATAKHVDREPKAPRERDLTKHPAYAAGLRRAQEALADHLAEDAHAIVRNVIEAELAGL